MGGGVVALGSRMIILTVVLMKRWLSQGGGGKWKAPLESTFPEGVRFLRGKELLSLLLRGSESSAEVVAFPLFGG